MLMRMIAYRMSVVALLAVPLAPMRLAAQETPDDLTREESACQDTFGRSLLDVAGRMGTCLAECFTQPGRSCGLFSSLDPITRDCLDRARAAEMVPVLQKCAGSACPECYAGGSCESFAGFQFDTARSSINAALSTLYCNDSFSADGLTRAEQRCQGRLARAGGRYVEAAARCFARCQKSVRRGDLPRSACRSTNLDTPVLDARTQQCIDRARSRFLESCDTGCSDFPECFPLGCEGTLAAVDSEARGFEPTTYCIDEPVQCYDGHLSEKEVCDPTAVPTGCPGGEYCRGCSYCSPPQCGDGLVEAPEVCDPGNPFSCASGTFCSDCLKQCTPITGATEDLTPCAARDRWTFQPGSAAAAFVRANTVDSATASDLVLSVQCDHGAGAFADDTFGCSFGFYGCPAASFWLFGDTTCDVTVSVYGGGSCVDPAIARYRLETSGTDLTLLDDDASPSGAFVADPG